MKNKLETIVDQKHLEIKELAKNPILSLTLREGAQTRSSHSMKRALENEGLAVIAEIKKRSPSVGEINSNLDPIFQAKRYLQGDVSAISILTDRHFFAGSLEDLKNVRKEMPQFPLLKKDFTIHPLQIAEAFLAQASAILLIVSILGPSTKSMLKEAQRMGLEALVEVHDQEELNIAIDSGAEMIGVNCRNLKTFEVNLDVAETLSIHIPKGIVKVAESGIKSLEDARRMRQCGYDAVLVGESLVRSNDPAFFIKSMRVLP